MHVQNGDYRIMIKNKVISKCTCSAYSAYLLFFYLPGEYRDISSMGWGTVDHPILLIYIQLTPTLMAEVYTYN